jgi:cob(I)alamin adenosyltransferase
LARAICRRAERSTIPLREENHIDAEIGKYLNRLSDFLFVAARSSAAFENKSETIWKKG